MAIAVVLETVAAVPGMTLPELWISKGCGLEQTEHR
jgi:hypothetical protein